MGRPFYLNEVEDPDLDWLVTNFLYERPDFIPVETDLLPLVLLPYHEKGDDEVVAEEEIAELESKQG
jgi:hypothetical protein